MLDPIEHATNEYYNNIERAERTLEDFNKRISDDLSIIDDAIARIMDVAKSYESYDFESEWQDAIKEMMC